MRWGYLRVAGVFALLMLTLASWPIASGSFSLAQESADLTTSVQNVVAADLGVSADSIVVTVVEQQGDWAYGTAVAPGSADDGNPQTRFFLANNVNGVWNVALRFTTEFDQLLQSAPPDFPSPTIRSTLEGFSPAGEGSSQLSFPFPANETWGFLGPHPAEGATTRDALDFYPYYDNAQNAPVLAMRGGVVYRPCDNMILIDHGDGWTTGYYHVINIAVQNGQVVQRGQQLGGTSAEHTCGGFANGPHVHIWVEFRGQSVAIAGRDIGGWTVEAGPNPYDGCLVKGSVRRCTVDGTNFVVNDSEIGSGQSGAVATLGVLYGSVGDAIPYTLTGFPANSSVGISWRRPGGSVVDLQPITTGADGSASSNLIVPPTTIGSGNTIRFTVGSIVRSSPFEIDPSLSVTPELVGIGEQVTVNIQGFGKKTAIDITYVDAKTYTRTKLGTITTSNTGGGSANFSIPSGLAPGPGSVEANVGYDYAFDDLRLVDGPTVWLNYNTVRAGDILNFGIARFPAGSDVALSMSPAGGGAAVPLTNATTNASGNAVGTFTMPSLLFGSWDLLAQAGGVSAHFQVTIAAAIYPSQDPAERGATVDVSAYGFTPNSPITISWPRENDPLMLGSGTTDAQGMATIAVSIPSFPDGAYLTLLAEDGASGKAYTSIEIQGGPPVGEAAVQTSTTRSTVGARMSYTLTDFPPASTVQITWIRVSGGTIDLGTITTDFFGSISGSLAIPATTGGFQEVRFSSAGINVSVPFEVVPRIKITPSTAQRGQGVGISLRGYAKKEVVRIRWKQGSSWVTVATVTTSNTGSANLTVLVPTWVPDGSTSVRGDGPIFRAQTNGLTISGGTFVPAGESASPTATPSPSPTPTTTAVASPGVTVTPPATETAQPTETAMPEPTIEPTIEPTLEPTEAPTEEPTETPTPVETSESTEEAGG